MTAAEDALGTRRERLAGLLRAAEVDAMLITKPVNVRYLSGLASTNAALLVRDDAAAVLATDARYAAAAGVGGVQVVLARATAAAALAHVAGSGRRRVGVEQHHLTVQAWDDLLVQATDVELVRVGALVELLRAQKDEQEISLLATACQVSVHALEQLLQSRLLGRTEAALARELESRMLLAGADGIAFDTIVAAGEHAAVPHHRPTARDVRRGDLLTIDFGAQVDGYHADCTRTVVVGARPLMWQQEIYDVVREAQRAGRDALGVGVECRSVDETCRGVIADAGFAERFVHGTGHGVGLEIHEAPALGPAGVGRLADRMLVTVEPGVYLPGRGGVRIEDTLVIRDTGAYLLTMTTTDLLVIDA